MKTVCSHIPKYNLKSLGVVLLNYMYLQGFLGVSNCRTPWQIHTVTK